MAESLRLDKILAHMGWGTRTEIKKMLKKGLVTVDGEVVRDPAIKIDPEKRIIQVAGETVAYREFVYLMLNKPAGYVSATEDDREATVLDLLSDEYRSFAPFPVGRLDKDTEGLLILTNDGQLAHELTAPRNTGGKRYSAMVQGEGGAREQEAFRRGLVLDDGYLTLPAELRIIKSGPRSEIEVLIYEGKYHQVKRMFRAVGKEVLYLRRLAMGLLELDESLQPGQYRELTEDELALLRKSGNAEKEKNMPKEELT